MHRARGAVQHGCSSKAEARGEYEKAVRENKVAQIRDGL